MSASNTKSRMSATLQSGAVRGALYVAIGLAIGQTMAYLLSLLAARVLGPANYGVFGSMLALLMVGSVLALGIQAAGARRVVLTGSDEQPQTGLSVIRWATYAAGSVAIATVIISPLLVWLLHLDGPLIIVLVALNLAPITLWGGFLGVTQGREANARLALVYAIGGIGRALGGIILVFATQSVTWTLVGMAAGTWVAAALSWFCSKALVAGPARRLSGFRIDVAHATHALLALFVLTNLDVLLARHFLSATEAGMYAAGAVVTKVTFWLPQFVATIAYPRMADHRRSETLTKAALAVAAIGIATTLAVAAVPSLVVSFIGGAAYAELASEVWVFAAIGASFALAQFLLYSQIAASKRAAIAVLWVAVCALVVFVWLFHASVLQIALIVLCVALTLAAVGIAELLVERRREARLAESVS